MASIKHILDKNSDANKEAFFLKIRELDSKILWDIKIEKHKEKRSLEQNDWARKFARSCGEYLGYTPDEMYELLMYKCNPKFITDVESGVEIRSAGHLSGLSTKDAAMVQDRMINWGLEMGFYFEDDK